MSDFRVIGGFKVNGYQVHAFKVDSKRLNGVPYTNGLATRSICEIVKENPTASSVTPLRPQGEEVKTFRDENKRLLYSTAGVNFEDVLNVTGKEMNMCSRCSNLLKNMKKYHVEDIALLRMLVKKKISYSKWAEYSQYPIEWLEAL